MTVTSELHYLQHQHSVTVQDLLRGNSEFPWIYTKKKTKQCIMQEHATMCTLTYF